MDKFYIGINIKNLINEKVKVLDQVGIVGTNRDVPVYKCVDESGNFYKIVGPNLSDTIIIHKYSYGGMGDCFPESVERFPSFKNGRYLFDYTWGN